MDSLWPPIEAPTSKPPVAILKEQASLLGMQTQNLVVAEVRPFETTVSMDTNIIDQAEKPRQWRPGGDGSLASLTELKSQFRYSFNLVAPALSHYRYQLFILSYGIELYPAVFRLDSDIALEITGAPGELIQVDNETELFDRLRTILNASKTKRVISAILAQSQALSAVA